ncbi:MAG: PD-(D/E)XK nuclease domain-containing protein [Gammaproteobacteria bacterium]|nr:PD-(D/E)XK nuclease domain-containing protein [Gammaproteobacteria bacterium]
MVAGYLTIAAEERRGPRTLYKLDYPNLEVRQSLSDGLLGYLAGRREETADQGIELGCLRAANDFEGFADRLRSFFAATPYRWQGANSPARHEAWYAGLLYACFRTIGLDLRVEDSSGKGRADMAALHGGEVFEFKMADGQGNGDSVAEKAIEQIREKEAMPRRTGTGESQSTSRAGGQEPGGG